MKQVTCAFCGYEILRGEDMATSSIYGSPNHIWLHVSCQKVEDEEIEKAGTNDIPSLRERYIKVSKDG